MPYDPTGFVSHEDELHRSQTWKRYCRAATTANITISTALNNGDTLDGITLATGDRVLVKDQSSGAQNGIYVVGASPGRAFDMDQDGTTSVVGSEVLGAVIHVIAGTTNAGTIWRCTNTTAPTLGTTALTFVSLGSGLSDPMTTRGDMIVRNASNVTARVGIGSAGKVWTSDGTDPSWQTPTGGGTVTPSYLGYNTVGGSTQAMTSGRLFCKQITAGAGGNVLLGVEAHIAVTAEAVVQFVWALWEDDSNVVGDLLVASPFGMSLAPIHSTGVYPARWIGQPITRALAASTKYWVGLAWIGGGGNPNLYYDGSGSDRYFGVGVTPYVQDGVYATQTDSTNKHSIRALVL